MASIFHAYDIRGIYPTDLNEDTALKIGKAAALYLKAKKLVVGQDARTSSDPLTQKLIEGIISTGCHVVMVSQTTTPLFYFSVNTLDVDGGIMVTASHNPAQYNGFKIVGRDTVPVGLSSGLHDVEGLMDVPVPEGVTPGSVVHEKLVDDYVNTVIELSGAAEQDLSQLRIVVDTSNGMSSLVLKNLFTKININVTPIFFDIDETFPNHSPDISRAENLKHLQAKVRELQANLGVAFDGDGDRIMLVDETGAIIRSDHLLGLLFQLMGKPRTVYDLRISRAVKALIGDKGTPSATGYVSIKKTMREHDAELGGELSGHFSFKVMHFSESGTLVMLKILVMMSKARDPISVMLKPFQKYAYSGEINIPLSTIGDRQAILATLKTNYHDGKLNEMDGVTVEYSDWWFNVRPSNTEPLMRLVVEAESQKQMERKRDELTELIKKAA